MTIDLATVAEHARWLLSEADPDDWSLASVGGLAEARGWLVRPEADAAGPRVVPFDDINERFADGRECRELAVPVVALAEPARSVEALAAAFRGVATVLKDALGPATSHGSGGPVGPWFTTTPQWGAPFLRWRRPGDRTLELRATTTGAELVLRPTEPYEVWRKDTHEWSEPATMGGFVVERDVPENEGLFTPGTSRPRTWKEWQPKLADFLRTLPAETAALGEPLTVHFVTGATRKAAISCTATGKLGLASSLRYLPDPASHGWCRPDRPYSDWELDGGGPGTVDGAALAATLVDVLRVEKVKSLGSLAVLKHPDGYLRLYGLGLP